MKKSLVTISIILCVLNGYSQNTFPSTGNVGIGTGSLRTNDKLVDPHKG
ncbi:MAG: hypothetical protein JXR03_00980 [Cyclobacteriaceae bacterium]